MPNWCSNSLNVTGPKPSLDDLEKWIVDHKNNLDLEAILPTPKELLEHDSPQSGKKANEFKKKYGAKDWYDWRVKNWGTKWDVNSSNDRIDESNLSVWFDSAWAQIGRAHV